MTRNKVDSPAILTRPLIPPRQLSGPHPPASPFCQSTACKGIFHTPRVCLEFSPTAPAPPSPLPRQRIWVPAWGAQSAPSRCVMRCVMTVRHTVRHAMRHDACHAPASLGPGESSGAGPRVKHCVPETPQGSMLSREWAAAWARGASAPPRFGAVLAPAEQGQPSGVSRAGSAERGQSSGVSRAGSAERGRPSRVGRAGLAEQGQSSGVSRAGSAERGQPSGVSRAGSAEQGQSSSRRPSSASRSIQSGGGPRPSA